MSSTSSTNRLTWRNFDAALRADPAVGGLDSQRDEERHRLALGQDVSLRAIVRARRARSRRRATEETRLSAPGEDLPVGLGLVEESLVKRPADRLAEQRHELGAVEVLVRRAALVVATHTPARARAQLDGIDGDPSRVLRIRRAWLAQRRAGQGPIEDELLDKLDDVH